MTQSHTCVALRPVLEVKSMAHLCHSAGFSCTAAQLIQRFPIRPPISRLGGRERGRQTGRKRGGGPARVLFALIWTFLCRLLVPAFLFSPRPAPVSSGFFLSDSGWKRRPRQVLPHTWHCPRVAQPDLPANHLPQVKMNSQRDLSSFLPDVKIVSTRVKQLLVE